MTQNEINLGHTILFLRPDGIVQMNAKDVEIGLEEAKSIVANVGKLTNESRAPFLCIASSFSMIDADVRNYMKTEEATRYSTAEAYVINSLAQKLIANFFIQFDKPNVPTKVFKNVDEAIAWLNTFKTV